MEKKCITKFMVFDGAWLWEEYLFTILKRLDYIHPENKKYSWIMIV
jgi:hypothetical protein